MVTPRKDGTATEHLLRPSHSRHHFGLGYSYLGALIPVFLAIKELLFVVRILQ